MNTGSNNRDKYLGEALKGKGPGKEFGDSVMKQVLAGAQGRKTKRRQENRIMFTYVAVTVVLLLLLIGFTQPAAALGSIRIPRLRTYIFNDPDLLWYGKIAAGTFILAFVSLIIHFTRRGVSPR